MTASPLGHTLVIANPAANKGKGVAGAEFVSRFLDTYESATTGHRLELTDRSGDATRLAAGAAGFDTVIALGGDGVIHEVVNGLMRLPRERRPQLGIIPLGSGNDYARTLGMAINDPEAALAQLVRADAVSAEVGRVNDVYFMETLSFGLDAAVALDTVERRKHDTSMTGEGLFVTSCLRIFSESSQGWRCTVSFDGEKVERLRTVIFAMQVGPTYGGGFQICPEADPTDGLLDVCYNVTKPPVIGVLGLVGLARFGKHAGSRVVRLRRFSHAEVLFETEPPCQVDGEKLTGTRYVVDVVPDALSVLVPHGWAPTGRRA